VATRHGDPISATTFIVYLGRIIDVIRNKDTVVRIQGHNINNLKFADDINMVEEERNQLQKNINKENLEKQHG